MIESNLDTTKDQGHIVLCPNTSTSWRTTKIILCCISCIALLIATGFAFAGLWMILPFAGLEVMALVLLTLWVAHQCQRQQVIYLDGERILVEQGHHVPKFTWEAELFWTRLIIDKSPYRGHANRLILRSKHEQLEIGEFLNEQDKKKLIAELRGVVKVVS